MSKTLLSLICCVVAVSLAACEGQLGGDFSLPTTTSEADLGTVLDGATGEVGSCGDLLISALETCDGNCPIACDDGNSCTSDTLTGAATTCDARCQATEITTCVSRDGCCPAGCDFDADDDCSDSCGDGVVDEQETCDGNCPSACDDGDACTDSLMTGSPDTCNVQCSTIAITACNDADGCCPAGCTASTDSDCAAVCGNGVIEGLELCDGDCPTSCDDGAACTADSLAGSADTCDAVCSNTLITQCVGGDGCCPTMCNQVNDSDCMAACGNDIVELGESCDGACPDCNDGVACTADVMAGSAATCNVMCTNTAITACVDGDGCCAPGCDSTSDDDCNAVCGNGVMESGETCDPIANCPTACDDMDVCTADTLVGDAAACDSVCLYAAITLCNNGDGCCPNGCNANNDDDCAAACDNSVVEPGETCDPLSSCPGAVADCYDGDACTGEVFSGDAATCTSVCTYNDVTACINGDGCCPTGCTLAMDTDCVATCGNDVVETGETCDGNCPSDCDDQDACTGDTLSGSAASCTAECQNVAVTVCIDADGCCPPACDETNDDDCSALCDNGVVESGETCDPLASCPTACDDADACTTDTLSGSNSNCTSECAYAAITMCVDGDGCCAPGCNANNDDDCAPMCDNGVVEAGEVCDPVASCPTACDDGDACTNDTLSGAAATCTSECTYDAVTACADSDGCCPATCNYTNDNDCPMVIDCRDPATWPSGWATLEDQIFAETNVRRTQAQSCGGNARAAQPAFTTSPELREAARCHALDMVTLNFFSHTGSNGSSPGDRINLTGYLWSTWGENIAAGNNTAVAILDQWMNSTGHCENIMSGGFEQLGVGYGYDAGATYRHYSVQVFATPQ